MITILVVLCASLFLGCLIIWDLWRKAVRGHFIRTFSFPVRLFDKFAVKHSNLTLKERQLVARGLRQFFLAYLHGNREYVSMPSQVADDLWHEFILYTRDYDAFCRRAFGRFLHHAPAVNLGNDKQKNTGLRRVWWQCCREENINPANASRLPLLFALDEKLKIEGGLRYALNNSALKREVEEYSPPIQYNYASDFSSKEYDGSTDGLADSDGGDGGGCGGD